MTSSSTRAGNTAARLRHRPASRAQPAGGVAAPPSVLGGWELVRLIGEGKWTRLFSARRAGASQADYILKLPQRAEPGVIATSLAMLRREALVGSQVSHPNLMTVLDGQFGDEPFIVLPRVVGITLRELLEHRRREFGCLIGASKFLPQSVWIVRQLAEALAALHAAGWLHGDVRPENVLVSRQGHSTLMELGLARRLGSRECHGGEVLAATLRYVSPESLLPLNSLTPQSDFYSLGTLLYELLSGEPLFGEADSTELALAHLRQAPLDIREAALDIPPQLGRLVMRMLAKEPLRRPAAEDVVRQLARVEIELMA